MRFGRTYFNAQAERDRKKRDSDPERIIAIARAKGEFRVSLRYRDDWLRRICHDLAAQGFLKFQGRRQSELVYTYIELPASEGGHS